MQEVVYIYLDDIRVPTEPHRKLVKNYDEFVNTIQSLPKNVSLYVSFDHDLADEHYTPEEYRDDYEKSKKYQESKKYKEKTGLDCAKRLMDYLKYNKMAEEGFNVHSANPVGADNIISYITNYMEYWFGNTPRITKDIYPFIINELGGEK